jgi:hypothetical protein
VTLATSRLAQIRRYVTRWAEPEAMCVDCGRMLEARLQWHGHQVHCPKAMLMDLLAEVDRLRDKEAV